MNYKERKRESLKTMIKIIIVLLILLGLALFLNWSNKALVTTNYIYENGNLPDAFEGFRITQVSDLQSEYFGEEQRELLAAVEATHPDIIVFTGDLIDRNHTDYEAARIAMEGLVGIAPVYYVNGNHEMALDETKIEAFYEELADMGVHVLFDRHARVNREGAELHLLGLSEHTVFACKDYVRSNKVRADEDMMKDALVRLSENVSEEDFVVLLSHEPQYLETYALPKIDLIFSGHAHGGQIRLPFTDGLYAPGQGPLPKMTSGMHTSGTSTLVISRGVGNSTFPFRVFNRPEIVTVELHRGEKSGKAGQKSDTW